MAKQKEVDVVLSEKSTLRRPKLGSFLQSEPDLSTSHEEKADFRQSNASFPSSKTSPTASPYAMSPLNLTASPYSKSPWILPPQSNPYEDTHYSQPGLIGSLVREEGHIYSLASSGDLLYTGSDSKNIRVWKNLSEFSGFKSSSGLVKAIAVSGEKIFTGHQDGKIRVWRFLSDRNRKAYTRVGTLPTTKDYIRSAMNPKNYVEVRRHRNVPWIRHYDAVSCMSLDEKQGLLYSGSWDRSVKVWRLSDSKCLESISAHDDAVNSVALGLNGFVFTGSADGSVKAWRRELVGKATRHVLVETLLEQESAVTAVAVGDASAPAVVYAGSSDGMVNFWEREKHFLVHGGALRGHKMAVLCLAVGGCLVFSGSADKSICAWRREEGGAHICLSVLTGHGGPVKCLAVAEEDRSDPRSEEEGCGGDRQWILYSGSLDRSVNVWRVLERAPVPPRLRDTCGASSPITRAGGGTASLRQ